MHDLSITQDRLKELLYYNKQFGIFVWKNDKGRSKKGTVAGTLTNRSYIKIKIDGALYTAHRLAFLFVCGRLPSDQVDHINGVRSDNSFSNLRECTPQENNLNQKIGSRNNSGVMGVRFNKKSQSWVSYIYMNRIQIHLGSYCDLFEACCARKSAELKHGFHPNHGRRA